jgi:hypothetical protein
MKSWVVESSKDGKTWLEIDRRVNRTQLNDKNVVVTFPMSSKTECRFIRLRQIDKNFWGSHEISISGFEVFGTLVGLK